MEAQLSAASPPSASVLLLLADISAAGLQLSGSAMPALARAIATCLDVRAAALFALSADGASLDLIAHYGLAERDLVGNKHLGKLAIAASVARNGHTQFYPLPASEFVGHTTEFCSRYGVTGALVAPLIIAPDVRSQEENARIGVICLYAQANQDRGALIAALELIAPFVSCAMRQSFAGDMLQFTAQAIERLTSSRDLDSFLHRIVSLLTREWGFGAVSAFVVDERSMTLRLRATTGLENRPQKSEVFYRMSDMGATARAFSVGGMQLLDGPAYVVGEPKFRESLNTGIESVLLLPIVEPRTLDDATQQRVGIIRVVNSVVHRNGSTVAVPISGNDVIFLNYVGRFIGSVSVAYGRAARAAEDFERSLHGIQNNLHFVNIALTHVTERSRALRNIEPEFAYSLPDSIHHVTALLWQVRRYSGVADHHSNAAGKVLLYGDVLAKLPPFVESVGRLYNAVRTRGVQWLDVVGRAEDLPGVRGDSEVYLTIFRNLVENAAKYSSRGVPLAIRIYWEIKEKFVSIFVEDNGIGIDEVDVPYIFKEGYKAENAMRRCTVGAGIGLSQCKALSEPFGADIMLVNARSPTVFRVTVPRWSGDE